MFASDLLENVPCPDSGICWRGFACKYNHDASVLQLQKALNILKSGENLGNSQIPIDTTDVDTEPTAKKQRIDGADQELPSPSKEAYMPTLPPLLPSIDSSFIEVPSDFYVPEYVGDAGDLEDLLKSSIDAVAKHLGSDDKTAPENNEPVDNSEYEPAFVTPVGGKRKTPTSVIKLRASIEDVGRQLSKINKADAKPRVGSLPTIADTEKQLQGSGGYNARKMMRDRVMKDVENENFRELGEPAGGDEEKRVKPTARVNSSKPIPSIQNKFLIKPPIQSNKPPISKPKQKKKEFLLNSDDEDEDEDDYEDDEDDEEEEKEPNKNTKPKPTTTNNKTLKPTSKSTSPLSKPLISGTTKTPPKNITTTNTKLTTNTNNRPITNINKVSPPKTTLPLAKNNASSTLKAISTNTSTTTKQPEKPKTPGLLAMGVGLTKEQALAAQKLRVDSDKSFAGGLLSASEYPSILFELRPKVPRKVRQTYLDKFLIQFLTNFPEEKAQAIEAAVKVESDIYSEAQTKMVYVNLCVHKMRTLFPSV